MPGWLCRQIRNDHAGVPPLEQNALVYVAQQQGLFAQNHLTVAVKDYDSGVAAMEALSKGEVDLAEAAEFPFVGVALRSEPIYIIATMTMAIWRASGRSITLRCHSTIPSSWR
jgi:hypothetical protein